MICYIATKNGKVKNIWEWFFQIFKNICFPSPFCCNSCAFACFSIFISLFNILKVYLQVSFCFCCGWSFGSFIIVVIFLCLYSHCLEQKGVIDRKWLLLSVPATTFSQSGYVDNKTTEFGVENLSQILITLKYPVYLILCPVAVVLVFNWWLNCLLNYHFINKLIFALPSCGRNFVFC